MPFVSSPSSTNEVNTAYRVSTTSTQISTASTQVCTANLSDATVYAFLTISIAEHEDKKVFQKTGRKITIKGSNTAGYDKSKVECFNCHKLGHFARECRQPRNQDNRNRNQDSSKRTVNVEEIASKAMVAIMELLELQEKGVIESGCSRHMTENVSYLSEYVEINGRYFASGRDPKGGSGPTWLFDIETLTKSMKYKPVTQDPLFSSSSKDSPGDGFKPLREEEKKDAKDLRNKDNEVLSTEEPKVNQEKDANVNSTNNINTVSPTANAASIKDNVIDKDIVYGCTNDPNIPNLEEINYSDDDGDVVVEAYMTNLDSNIPVSPILTSKIYKDHPAEQIIRDINSAPQTRRMTKNVTNYVQIAASLDIGGFTIWQEGHLNNINLKNKKDERGIVVRNKERMVAQGRTQEEGIDYNEVFALVARIKAIRLLLAYASFKDFVVYPMDVKSVFLYGIEEEVYVCQPLGIEDPKFPHKVYKVEKALHGLHQAPRACDTKDDGIFISQDKYVDKIFKKFGFLTMKTASTPMETSKPLLKDKNAKDVDVHLYRSMISSLMYLTSSRPDIIYDVCACIRFQVKPKVSHLHAVKRIFKYLKSQPKLGRWYPKDTPSDLEAYTNSDYPGEILDKKSITRGLPEFADDTVTDYSKPSPAIESTSDDVQNKNLSVTKTEASPSTISSKPFIKFVKPVDSPIVVKIERKETIRKPSIKYVELYRKPSKKSTVSRNQRNWNNLKSQQLGKLTTAVNVDVVE
nr:hypothetical protein [Tanacetum cinerariifolium]